MLTIEQIREQISDRNLAEVARRLKVTRPWLSAVINGRVPASADMIRRLSEYLSANK